MSTGSFGPSSSFRLSSTSGDQAGSARYPSPWWDIAQMDLPTTIKSLFAKCRYHALLNPLVSSTVKKMAAYPITQIVIDEQPVEGFKKNKERWEDLLYHVLKVQQAQVNFGLNYNTFGNCLVSINYPFFKWLKCSGCGFEQRIKKLKFRKDWDFKDFQYWLNCPKCLRNSEAEVEDRWYKSYRDIKLNSWNPEDVDIDYNPITQRTEYAYTIPAKVRNSILQKKQSYLEETPVPFMQAIKHKRQVILVPENVYHFKAPTPSLANNDEGWGYPPILPALKDSFYLQIMKKAQEAIMLEHLVPLDIIFPTGMDQVNPYATVNLSDWKSRVEKEIARWRGDPNYKPILPLPVGYQRIGGNGKALMLTQEIRAWSEHIVAGMNVPQEFVFGGLTWSGSSVSLRMLENQFLNYRDMHDQFLQYFLVPAVSRFMGWEPVQLHMKNFRMADDMQAKQLLMNLNQMKQISTKTLLSEFNLDSNDELNTIEQELRRNDEIMTMDSLMKAEIQGEVQKITTKYQILAQKQMTEAQAAMGVPTNPNAPPDPNAQQGGPAVQQGQPAEIDVTQVAQGWAKKIASMPDTEKAGILQRIGSESPQLHQLILQYIGQMQGADMRPLPEQRPPRRAGAV